MVVREAVLKLVSAENMTKSLLSVNFSAKTIHHHQEEGERA